MFKEIFLPILFVTAVCALIAFCAMRFAMFLATLERKGGMYRIFKKKFYKKDLLMPCKECGKSLFKRIERRANERRIAENIRGVEMMCFNPDCEAHHKELPFEYFEGAEFETLVRST